MAQIQQEPFEGVSVLSEIRRGMPVYDVEFVKLGMVTRIYWGADTEHPDSDDFETTFLGVVSLPPEAAALIRQEGCIRVDTGMIFGNYYVLPYQVGYFTEEGMFLLARGDELMMF
jgi:hypothetical protein